MTLGEIAKQARRNLNDNLWDYLRGGADSEAAVKRNRLALSSWAYRPKVLNDVSDIRTERQLLGAGLRIPVVLPPIGSVQQFDPGGGVSVAEAAAEFGVTMILSSACLPDFETVAKTPGASKIFQLYLIGDRAWMDDVIARATEAGYDGFCLTVDTALYSRRERDIHKRYVPGSGRRSLLDPRDQDTGSADFLAQARMDWAPSRTSRRTSTSMGLKGIAAPRRTRRARWMPGRRRPTSRTTAAPASTTPRAGHRHAARGGRAVDGRVPITSTAASRAAPTSSRVCAWAPPPSARAACSPSAWPPAASRAPCAPSNCSNRRSS